MKMTRLLFAALAAVSLVTCAHAQSNASESVGHNKFATRSDIKCVTTRQTTDLGPDEHGRLATAWR